MKPLTAQTSLEPHHTTLPTAESQEAEAEVPGPQDVAPHSPPLWPRLHFTTVARWRKKRRKKTGEKEESGAGISLGGFVEYKSSPEALSDGARDMQRVGKGGRGGAGFETVTRSGIRAAWGGPFAARSRRGCWQLRLRPLPLCPRAGPWPQSGASGTSD